MGFFSNVSKIDLKCSDRAGRFVGVSPCSMSSLLLLVGSYRTSGVLVDLCESGIVKCDAGCANDVYMVIE